MTSYATQFVVRFVRLLRAHVAGTVVRFITRLEERKLRSPVVDDTPPSTPRSQDYTHARLRRELLASEGCSRNEKACASHNYCISKRLLSLVTFP
jgi:hypothetical protein